MWLYVILLNQLQSVHGWTYEAASAWSIEFPECGESMQSPINIQDASTTDRPELSAPLVNYKWVAPEESNLTVSTLGLTLSVADGGYMLPWIEPEGPVLYVEEVTFHAPSEHQINSTYFDLEIQMLHRDKATMELHQLAILAKKKKEDPSYSGSSTKKENPFLKLLALTSVDSSNKGTFPLNASINLGWSLPFSMEFYFYQGSLTHPPCASTNWYILKTPLEISEEEINQVKSLLPKYNTRPLQSIQGRSVYSTVAFEAEVEKAEKFYTAVVLIQMIGLTIATIVLGGLSAFVFGEMYQRGLHWCRKSSCCQGKKMADD